MRHILALIVLVGFSALDVQASVIVADGNWNTGATWTGGIPNADSAVAENTSTNGRTTTLDINATVGTIRATSRGSFTINSNGTNFLTLDNGLGTANITGSTAGSSTDTTVTINPNIFIAGDLQITQNPNTTAGVDRRVIITGGISGNGNISVTSSEDSPGGVRLTGSVNNTGILTWTGTSTDTFYSAITGTIGSNVNSLTKNGAGTLTLSGTSNAYAGGTTVNAGTLRAQTADALSTGDVTVEDGAILQLNAAAMAASAELYLLSNGLNTLFASVVLNSSMNIAGLYFDGVGQSAGTWGATGSGATNTNDDYFSGTGVLTVVPEPSTYALLGLGMGALWFLRRRNGRS